MSEYDQMSEEELAQFIETSNAEMDDTKPEEPAEEPEASEQPEENTEQETEEPEQEETEEPAAEQEQEEEVEESEFTKGKSRKELLEMIQNGTKKISQLGNEKSEYQKKLEQLTTKQLEVLSQKQQETEKDVLDEIKQKYDEETIQDIQLIVQKTLKSERQRQEEQSQQQIKKVNERNEDAWKMVAETDPEFLKQYNEQIISEIQADRKGTYDQPGWVFRRVIELKNQSKQGNAPTNKKSVVKRPVSKTIGSGASKPMSRASRKSVDAMSPEEYLEHIQHTKGIDLRQGL